VNPAGHAVSLRAYSGAAVATVEHCAHTPNSSNSWLMLVYPYSAATDLAHCSTLGASIS
jgi:hypothetical protein